MKRNVVDILRENNLTYMRKGKELFTSIEEKDGMRVVRRLEVPLALQIEDGYDDLGKKMLIDQDGNRVEGFVRPRGRALGMNRCEVMFDADGNGLWKNIEERIEEMKQFVYLGIIIAVCRHHIKTDNRIQIGTEYLGTFVYVKGWLMC